MQLPEIVQSAGAVEYTDYISTEGHYECSGHDI